VKFIIGIFFLFAEYYSSAQSSIIEIKTNSLGASLGGVTVQLIRYSDSALLKTTITDSKGFSKFNDVPQGAYRLKCSFVGYDTQFSGLINLENTSVTKSVSIELRPIQKKLDAITVTASKPLFQKLDDRIVVNVSGSTLNSGSTAMEVLTRSPGVSVDQNDNISLRGRKGITIMIDGKPAPMSDADLANYLKSLPSETIDRIEIITNPSSMYEASGNAGIIDIRLKKDQRYGINGTLNTSIGQGKYSKYNTGTTFNYRNKRINVFGNYSFNYKDKYNEYLTSRNFSENGISKGSYDQDDYIKFPIKDNTARLGVDYFPDNNTIIGVVANGNFFKVNWTSMDTSTAFSPAHKIDSSYNSIARSKDNYVNTLYNINFKHNFSETDIISADADYGTFSNKRGSTNYTLFYDADGKPQHNPLQLNGTQSGNIEIRSGKLDYVKKISNEKKIEAGIKTSKVTSISDALFYNISTGTPVLDTLETNHYKYVETNNAAYVNFKAKFNKLNVQAGVRLERTGLDGKQDNGNIHFDSSYLKLFPSANINYSLENEQTIGISFNRRIDRPTYLQLNPLVHLLDVSTYLAGNPGLQPEFTWSYELNYSRKSLNASFNYSRTSNHITLVTFPNPKLSNGTNKVNLQTEINVPDYQHAGFTLSVPFTISKKWNIITNGTLFRNSYNAYITNTILNASITGYNLTINNSIKLVNDITTELNGEFNSADREGFIYGQAVWQLNAGLQKTILKNKGNLKLSATDLFFTYNYKGTNDVTGYHEVWSSTIDTRVVTLSFNWRFGNNKIAAVRNRTTSSEEESKRAR
jgi:Outer membrane receptor proteins, mostly Fe transport